LQKAGISPEFYEMFFSQKENPEITEEQIKAQEEEAKAKKEKEEADKKEAERRAKIDNLYNTFAKSNYKGKYWGEGAEIIHDYDNNGNFDSIKFTNDFIRKLSFNYDLLRKIFLSDDNVSVGGKVD
jgi:membrane protein involved in colicin uptake